MTTLSIAEATGWVAAVFARNGCSAANAHSVARPLVAAEADGLKGHGLSRLPTYLQMLRSRKIDGQACASATRPRPGVLAIDAALGFAYPALDLAVAELPAIAAAQGVAVAPIRRSSHCGAAGLPCEALARRGLVALLFANTPGGMAPWGGRKLVFGTNPIAFAAPLEGQEPAVVDLALSKVARGPIIAAKQRGESIPEGCGRSTLTATPPPTRQRRSRARCCRSATPRALRWPSWWRYSPPACRGEPRLRGIVLPRRRRAAAGDGAIADRH